MARTRTNHPARRLLSLLLALLLLSALAPAALAVEAEDPYLSSAEALHDLGLFQGTSTNADGTPIYDLDKTPTRNQALIMLVRLLGKEAEAKAGAWDIPFTDVSEGMKPYVGYAYANGLTKGWSAESFRGTQRIPGNQYVSFLLRALGYESGKDFEVSQATAFSDEIGLTAGQSLANFTRGDVAQLSVVALSTPLKDSETTMMQKLQADGVIPTEAETPERPAYLLPDVVAPEGLEFHEIPNKYPYVALYGDAPDGFEATRFEYAVGEDDYYFRLSFTSKTVKEFFVLLTNRADNLDSSYLYEPTELFRYAADPESGVFTCKVEKSLFDTYGYLQIGPSEDRHQAPDYLFQVGYFLLNDGKEPDFQEVEYFRDDSYEVEDFQFQSIEYAEVTGGRLYRLNFTNGHRRTVQFWLTEWGSESEWNNLPSFCFHPEAGDTSILYYLPNRILTSDLNDLIIRVRDNDYDGSCQEHGYIDVFLDDQFPDWYYNNEDSDD